MFSAATLWDLFVLRAENNFQLQNHKKPKVSLTPLLAPDPINKTVGVWMLLFQPLNSVTNLSNIFIKDDFNE